MDGLSHELRLPLLSSTDMCTIEVSIAARLHLAGTPKEAIVAAFRLARSNGTSLLDEVIASGAVDEITLARVIAATLGLAFEPIEKGAMLIASSLADLGGPCQARRLTV